MRNKVNDIDIKIPKYYFLNNININNIKSFDPNNIKIDENSLKNFSFTLLDM